MNKRLNVDLHSHSTVSDGVLSPQEVAQRAYLNGVDLWSLTDHDEVGGQAIAQMSAKQLGMRYITGIELSVTWANKTLHIVGLNIDPNNKNLTAALLQMQQDRTQRAKKIAEKLSNFGINDAYEGALAECKNPKLLSRTHFARFLVKNNYCKTMQEVFDRYLGDDKPANVPGQWITLERCLKLIELAGGVSIIAHPGRYTFNTEQYKKLFQTFKDLGGAGIEVITGSHKLDEYQVYAQIAKEYGFYASIGSDFHSPRESRIDLGRLPALPDDLKPIWQILGVI